jgi:hypothetical protein
VELDGECVAVLTDPQFFDMFWTSFHVVPVMDDPVERMRISTDRGWWHQNKLVFRNRLLDEIVEIAFVVGDVFTESGRVILRGLYLSEDLRKG